MINCFLEKFLVKLFKIVTFFFLPFEEKDEYPCERAREVKLQAKEKKESGVDSGKLVKPGPKMNKSLQKDTKKQINIKIKNLKVDILDFKKK